MYIKVTFWWSKHLSKKKILNSTSIIYMKNEDARPQWHQLWMSAYGIPNKGTDNVPMHRGTLSLALFLSLCLVLSLIGIHQCVLPRQPAGCLGITGLWVNISLIFHGSKFSPGISLEHVLDFPVPWRSYTLIAQTGVFHLKALHMFGFFVYCWLWKWIWCLVLHTMTQATARYYIVRSIS